ncbi:MAG TPA: hypothetical protein VMY35_13410 [Phycisphaerae bacterium]|nr:hypothetical protein [Phycisphaerae bacterium]
MRDAAHYRRMFSDNPDAQSGFALAARAILAARGLIEVGASDAWRDAAHAMRARHGGHFPASVVLDEMARVEAMSEDEFDAWLTGDGTE